MGLLREAIEVHRRGTVDERRTWVLQHPWSSSFAVCLVVAVGVAVAGAVVRPGAVSFAEALALFGATFGVARLLLVLADVRPARPGPRSPG